MLKIGDQVKVNEKVNVGLYFKNPTFIKNIEKCAERTNTCSLDYCPGKIMLTGSALFKCFGYSVMGGFAIKK